MKSFKVVDGDIFFGTDNNIIMVEGSGEEAQALERCFTTDAGEWFLNARHGLEYSKIRGKGVTDEAIQMAVIKAALQDKRVKEIIDIEITHKPKRAVDIVFHCKLASGSAVAIPLYFND